MTMRPYRGICCHRPTSPVGEVAMAVFSKALSSANCDFGDALILRERNDVLLRSAQMQPCQLWGIVADLIQRWGSGRLVVAALDESG